MKDVIRFFIAALFTLVTFTSNAQVVVDAHGHRVVSKVVSSYYSTKTVTLSFTYDDALRLTGLVREVDDVSSDVSIKDVMWVDGMVIRRKSYMDGKDIGSSVYDFDDRGVIVRRTGYGDRVRPFYSYHYEDVDGEWKLIREDMVMLALTADGMWESGENVDMRIFGYADGDLEYGHDAFSVGYDSEGVAVPNRVRIKWDDIVYSPVENDMNISVTELLFDGDYLADFERVSTWMNTRSRHLPLSKRDMKASYEKDVEGSVVRIKVEECGCVVLDVSIEYLR